MPLFHLAKEKLAALEPTTFEGVGIRERADLQRVLRSNIDAIAPNCLVISEEFDEWADSKRRIDLLAVDREARLVVVELKRSEDGGHMELQAIRYAAMVSTLTFERAVLLYARFLNLNGETGEAQTRLLDFLGWSEPDSEPFAQEVRIVLASADFSREVTSTVMWLNNHDLDIRCVRMRPYKFGNEVVIDTQQIIPLPEAAEFQVQLREKARLEKATVAGYRDFTKYDLELSGRTIHRLNKRRLVLETVRYVLARGATPETIEQIIDFKRGALWRAAEGDLGRDDFIEAAFATEGLGRARRFFCDDEDLFHIGGRTFAFSNQWGDPNASIVVARLLKQYGTGAERPVALNAEA